MQTTDIRVASDLLTTFLDELLSALALKHFPHKLDSFCEKKLYFAARLKIPQAVENGSL